MRTPRRATPVDVEALVRLRALTTDGVDDGRWRSAAGWWFAKRLDHDDDCAAFVIEHDHRVVAGAAGHCVRGAPSPDNPTGSSATCSTWPPSRPGSGRVSRRPVSRA